ncbi:hypothetical protein [Streptosporangium sp. NPDC001681]|uniref:hypothetical protein n=1 Tax=Streptosporangium sp. NPDC001681 TaxID=3154395 RepID=UPI00331C2458
MTSGHITPQIAADVLAFRHGGRISSTFHQRLLAAIAAADAPDRNKLAAEYPAYVAAYELAAHTDSGTDFLRDRVANRSA